MNNNNLFTIGELAKTMNITRKIILNYEVKGLITPDKKDGSTGNRYYSIDTFTQIRTIRAFQHLGLSLDEIRNYFNDEVDMSSIIKRLENMRDELNLAISKLKERTHSTNDFIEKISTIPQFVYKRKYTSSTIADKTNLLRNTALKAMKAYGTDITKRMYFIEYDATSPEDTSYCVAVPEGSKGEYIEYIPPTRALSLYHHGAYEDIPETHKKLIQYAKENGIELTGTFRSVFLEGPPQHNDKSKFITQIIALAK